MDNMQIGDFVVVWMCVCVFHTAHRAMADVEAMEEVLKHPQASCILTTLPQKSASEVMEAWEARKRQRQTKC